MSLAASEARRVVRLDDPGDLLGLAAAAGRGPLFYFENPSRGTAVLALGAAAEIRAAGAGRFGEAARAARSLFAALAPSDPPPLLVGGFAFSPDGPRERAWREFPALRFVLPELAWIRRGGTVHLLRVESSLVSPPATAPRAASPVRPALPRLRRTEAPGEHGRWRAAVEDARRAIAAGRFAKVVIARRSVLRAERPFAPAPLLAAARAARPACTSFWIRAGETSFVGSSPELLLRLRGRRLETEALAGSAARGATVAEDERLGERLLGSEKERREHDLVVESIRAALGPLSRSLVASNPPGLLRLPEAQHLQTGVRAELDDGTSLLEAAGRLHPTAAVCGWPRTPARAWIARAERDRGWYSGAVGWLDAAGDGELVVALRCGLIDSGALSLWAGAGIVEGSDPDAEFAETEAKLAALLAPETAP